jgi:polyhydroxyalkanoate synthesis regulator phasin
VNLLIESGEVTEQEGNQLLRKLLAPGHQSLSVGEEGGERILEFLRERQISTKRDFQTLIQRVEGLSKRVDSLNLNRLQIEENNKED